MSNGLFPRASQANLLASSPLVVTGLQTSATAVGPQSAIGNLGSANNGLSVLASGLLVFNGATYDRMTSANGADNTGGTGLLGAGTMGWSGAVWLRQNTLTNASDANTTAFQSLAVGNFPYIFNGTTWDRQRSIGASVATAGTGIAAVGPLVDSGAATYVQLKSGSAANMASTTQANQLGIALPGEWGVTHIPAVNTTPIATKAAGAAGVRHVARSITVSAGGNGAVPNFTDFYLRDGASTAGTIIWSVRIIIPATGTVVLSVSCNLVGSAATAMTLESSGASGAATYQSVSLSGYSTI